jgi:hypothetical protein
MMLLLLVCRWTVSPTPSPPWIPLHLARFRPSAPSSQSNLCSVINIIIEDASSLPRQPSFRSRPWLAAQTSNWTSTHLTPRTRIVTYMHRSETRTTMAGFSYPCQKGEQKNISHNFNLGTELSNSHLFQEIALLPALSTFYSASNIFRPSHYIHRIAPRYLRAAYSKQPAESALS